MDRVALFPIPGGVNFPNTKVPFHIFEPRYRKMVQDCIDNNIPIAVCHTGGVVPSRSVHTSNLNHSNTLEKNLQTYIPQNIFSAGYAKIINTTDDGRFLIEIEMIKRLKIIKETQQVPYKMADCEILEDYKEVKFSQSTTDIITQKVFINNFFIRQANGDEKLLSMIDKLLTNENNINIYTFVIFRFLRLDADLMQKILESRDALYRLDLIHQTISSALGEH